MRYARLHWSAALDRTPAATNERVNARDRQREETRRRVYLAALEVFRRDGVQACRIEDIADAAGVSRGAFYFHFPTKEDVLLELLRESTERVGAALERVPENAPVDEVLASVARAIAAEWQDDRGILPDVASVALRLSTGATPPGEVDPVRGTVQARFRAASARGELLGAVPPEVLADLFMMQQLVVAVLWCSQPVGTLADTLQGAAHLFLEGARLRA